MQVSQFVYTKVPPEQSPFKKTDFHMLFYPTSLLTPQRVREIEERIHFPGEDFESKKTIFYFNIKGEAYLCILHMQNLPETRDTFGRGGIFICHGFLIPPNLWKHSSHPMTFFELMKDKLFITPEEALNSPLADKKTGNIEPIELAEDKVKSLPQELPKLSEFEKKLLICLIKIANQRTQNLKLLLRGEPDKISYILDRIFAYIPDELKPALGWDSMLENGNLAYYPLNIAGYRKYPPTGAVSAQADIDAEEIKENVQNVLLPQIPIERGLYYCAESIKDKAEIEEMYTLSLLIEGRARHIVPVKLPLHKKCFLEVNKEEIKKAFLKVAEEVCQGSLSAQILEYISSTISQEEALLFLADVASRKGKLAFYIEKALLERNLPLSQPLPETLLKEGSTLLELINEFCKTGKIREERLNILERGKKVEFIKYLLMTDGKHRGMILEFLKKDRACFLELFTSSPTKEVIKSWIIEVLEKNKTFKEIAPLLLKEAEKEDAVFSLLKGEIDYLRLAENIMLREDALSENERKRLFSWAKKRKFLRKHISYAPHRGYSPPEESLKGTFLEPVQEEEKLFHNLKEKISTFKEKIINLIFGREK